ncbi:hypothetical protein GCM10017764_31320 [Sphingobacterium griseoflavum]|uniref:40S ribosomal protein S30 n=1 Tax=Sphingobacterium griseoflavum TaxID=1474952 RepID=A0ABQ3HYZ5_9SPHI|nr:hypothetical protein GCM10017764_31320 [Sphingobacterium griseoflavum]
MGRGTDMFRLATQRKYIEVNRQSAMHPGNTKKRKAKKDVRQAEMKRYFRLDGNTAIVRKLQMRPFVYLGRICCIKVF